MPEPKMGTTKVPVCTRVAFHYLTEWAKKSRKRLRIQSRYLKPREIRTRGPANSPHRGCPGCQSQERQFCMGTVSATMI